MKKEDWTFLLIRVLGLYLAVTHFASLPGQIFTLVMNLSLNQNTTFAPFAFYQWQAPVTSAIMLWIGCMFVFKTKRIMALIQRHDEVPQEKSVPEPAKTPAPTTYDY